MGLENWKLSKLAELDRARLSRYTRHLPMAAALVLVLLIAHSMADLSWQLLPLTEDDAAPPTGAHSVQVTDNGDTAVDLDRLVALSFFGDPDPEDDRDQEIDLADVDAPETQLNLELRGVLATEIPDMARAIIASGRGDDKSYKVGDNIESGASLRAVYSDRVILERGGELETLRLPRDEDEDGFARSSRRNGSREQADREVTVPDEVADLRSEIRDNPEKITDVIRPTPHHVDGEMVGFRIFPGRMRDEFQQLGLRSGDIVTAINGQPMDSPAAAMTLINDLEDATSVNLTIERGGEQTSVSISLSQ